MGSWKDKFSSKKSALSSGSRKSQTNPWASAPAPAPAPVPVSQQAPFAAELSGDLPPPPPYTPTTEPTPVSQTNTSQRFGRDDSGLPSYRMATNRFVTSAEDPYAFLSSFDTVFLIDDSGSMAGRSWREVQQALRAITPICTAHDANGIDVYFLNARNTLHQGDDNPAGGWKNITTPWQVETLFTNVRPGGATPTGTRINQILRPYLRQYERAVARTGNPDECGVKPINMIVITDGVPTDDPEGVIINAARKLDALDAPSHQVGIQFFQVGCEPGAAEALRDLDDGLSGRGGGVAVRDMVDTVTWDSRHGRELTAEGILKVVLGAVVRRLDRRRLRS
ncbi:hypothetical protein VTJ04DRAFT_8509 [Mycothermus thermophilus]|uniref:uncharacterized protein n=1 Tax=Humicola insolens TaxID=85995 RepID=UPI0037433271